MQGNTLFPATSIGGLIKSWAERAPENIAITASGKTGLTYARLQSQANYVIATLNDAGVGRNDRVAILVPRGPEMAACISCVATGAAAMPLNPGLRSNDFKMCLATAGVRALIIKSGFESPARDVAKAAGIPILQLTSSETGEAGCFRLETESTGASNPCDSGFARPEDIAIVLTTSGTTSQPKVVPLTHANVSIAAQNIGKSLALSPEDRCLNIMPIFHGHGLIGGLLASIASGGSVFSASGPHAPQFFDWLRESEATWYTAVPTVHQAIMERIQQQSSSVPRNSLRFIRSCSASLRPKLMSDLEDAFQVPVIEAYGMTETSHQIASNPLPPRARKPGSVGLATGVEISIVNHDGEVVASGEKGEVVIRGATVVEGYENNPEANREAFANGWFRTGDEGHLDEEGYLYLTGRLKELINRGAEKISPREIDEAILEHPAVAQAVAFAIPHPRLGEDVAAAVVLRHGQQVNEQEIREFVSGKLANFKIPRRILIVDEIPKGPTGKLQRIGLAKAVGLAPKNDTQEETKREFVAPRNATETMLADIWVGLLVMPAVGVDDDFFDLGGDSILAAELLHRISERTGVTLPLVRFFEAPTVAKQAEMIERKEIAKPIPLLVPLQSSGSQLPFFCVPPGGDVSGFRELARLVSNDRPFYALQPFELGSQEKYTIGGAADSYVKEIKSVQPTGPYFLGGHCAGGFPALQVARRLLSQGDEVALLAVIHPLVEGVYYHPVSAHWRKFRSLALGEKLSYAAERFRYVGSIAARKVKRQISSPVNPPAKPESPESLSEQRVNGQIHKINRHRWRRHLLETYPGKIDLFVTESGLEDLRPSLDPRILWGRMAQQGLNTHIIPGDHMSVLRYPHVKILAEELRGCLDSADKTASSEEPAKINSESSRDIFVDR